MIVQFENKADNLAELIALLSTRTVFFDLDGVCIDATHRQILKPDGSLDLAKYRENSTARKIAKDKELPFLQALQHCVSRDHYHGVHIATARVMCPYTKKWLEKRGALPSSTISRDGENDTRRDHVLKHAGITQVLPYANQRRRAVLIDDNMNNLLMASDDLGMLAIHVPFAGH